MRTKISRSNRIRKIIMVLLAVAVLMIPIGLGVRLADLWSNVEDILGLGGMSVSANAEINDIRRQISNQEVRAANIAAERRDRQNVISRMRNEQANQEQLLEEYIRLISSIEDEITENEFLLTLTREYMEQMESRVDELYDRHERNFQLFLELLRFTYDSGTIGPLEMFLNADSLPALLTQLDRMAEMTNYTRDIIRNLQNDRIEIQQSQETFTRSMEQIAELNGRLDERRAELSLKEEELDRQINSLASSIAAAEAQQRQIEQDERDIQAAITASQTRLAAAIAEQERRDREAAEAAERERARLAAEAAARAAAADRAVRTTANNAVAANANSAPAVAGPGDMIWPLNRRFSTVSSHFGMRTHPITRRQEFHNGIDIPAPRGENIYAVRGGVVIVSTFNRSAGNFIVIDHGGGITTTYSHASVLISNVGDVVTQGQVIARVGSTGMSTGNHLHFEVARNGVRQNPLNGWVRRP